MEFFLERIASSLYDEFGNDLNRHCLVFPGRRAGLYFLKYLSARITGPVWTPPIMTINDLFRKFSDLKAAENEILLFELYKVYRNLKKSPEGFDEFFFWGDMLLNDFDDIDKYLVNAGTLFANISDIKEIDWIFGDLTEEQAEIIRRFWINFDSDRPTREKEGFVSIWKILVPLYTGFRNSLREKNLGYEGMIFRDVAENSVDNFPADVQWDIVHFIGFNALNQCEKKLMLKLRKEGRARFYWDYDNSYIGHGKMNSAGFFMMDNLKVFGNDMYSGWSYDTYLNEKNPEVTRRVIDASSDVAQVKILPSLLEGLGTISPENACHTAVILADENLLLPLLTSIPDNIGDVNITMGFPLKQTLAYCLVKDLIELQTGSIARDGIVFFSRKNVSGLLKNRLITGIINGKDSAILQAILTDNSTYIPEGRFTESDRLKMIFTRPSSPASLPDYFKNILSFIATRFDGESSQRNLLNEFIYRIILSLNRLEPVSKSPEVTFSTVTWMRIFEKLLKMQSVPFSGEPLSGIQIMGVLETRSLDFENIIMLSVNEGVLPSGSAGSSFIPFSLREAFGLPSINHRESVYAYHFYRLLQRAKNVTFIYNSNSEGLRSGEMSRFLLQMKYEPELSPGFFNLNFTVRTTSRISEMIERTEEHSGMLRKRYFEDKKILSPSAINTWLSCRMKFFFQYVNGLTEPDKVPDDVDPATLGNLLHEMMSECYLSSKGTEITKEFVSRLIDDRPKLNFLINNAFCKKLNRIGDQVAEGNELIVREVLMAYLLRILKADRACAPFRILHLEESFSFGINADTESDPFQIRVGGKIDRIDMKDGKVRIVDYKTGNVCDSIRSVASLFAEDRKKDLDAWLQILLYCEAFLSENSNTGIYPLIYKIKRSGSDKLSGRLTLKEDSGTELVIDDYSIVRKQFTEGLRSLVSTIFSRKENFYMTADSWNKCGNCTYHSLCLR